MGIFSRSTRPAQPAADDAGGDTLMMGQEHEREQKQEPAAASSEGEVPLRLRDALVLRAPAAWR